MGIINFIKHNQIKGPEVVKDIDFKEIETLESYLGKVGDDQKDLIQSQVNKCKFGLDGEQRVMYELKHLKVPALIIHDLTLFDKNAEQSQIDFVVLTANCGFVIESKSLTGNVTINSDGDFKRQFVNSEGKVYKTEGMYSPIRQNEIHIDVLNDFISNNKLIKNYPIESIVVISNSKTIINKSYASKNMKDIIVKYDQLDNKILRSMSLHADVDVSDGKLKELANSLIENDTPRVIDYVSSLKLKLVDDSIQEETIKVQEKGFIDNAEVAQKISDDSLINSLKAYRLQKSKELRCQPYFVFNNQLMSDIILKMPKNKTELVEVPGFGEKKYELFGKDILKIINGNEQVEEKENTAQDKSANQEDYRLIAELKKYRYNKSKELNIKPYYVFNDAQMNEIVSKKVTTKEAFLSISGFADKKYQTYGVDIINIVKKHL